mmetsp:Transcript_67387/g.130217  ORF Transcript_67387/g.130217 Transcript_67387/m.130217 type:complete len:231 (-) Transcript_67387:1612-2304(-)
MQTRSIVGLQASRKNSAEDQVAAMQRRMRLALPGVFSPLMLLHLHQGLQVNAHCLMMIGWNVATRALHLTSVTRRDVAISTQVHLACLSVSSGSMVHPESLSEGGNSVPSWGHRELTVAGKASHAHNVHKRVAVIVTHRRLEYHIAITHWKMHLQRESLRWSSAQCLIQKRWIVVSMESPRTIAKTKVVATCIHSTVAYLTASTKRVLNLVQRLSETCCPIQAWFTCAAL